jgi:tetratricopeptide (TPR) repeat protein
MRAGCFAEKRVIDLLNHRFVPYFFNRGGPGKGHDSAARKFTVGKTKNPYAYFAAFTPSGEYLGETEIYADKDDVFAWLMELLKKHPEYARPTEFEKQLLEAGKDRKISRESPLLASYAQLSEELGKYKEAKRAYKRIVKADIEREDSAHAQLALLRIARYRKRWQEHEELEGALRTFDKQKELSTDLAMERGHRLLAKKKYQEARDLLQPLSKLATGSSRLAEIHFYAGVSCWFLKDRDWAKFHWCWIVENLPDDRFYMRAYVAAAAEIMPYPNPELGNYKARGMIGTEHIVREVRRSKKVYRRLLPRFEKGEYED